MTGRVALYLNDGTGLFVPTLITASTRHLRLLTVADFDGDEHLDLATVAYGGGGNYPLLILRGNGAGGFASPEIITNTPLSSRLLCAGDFDANGFVDLAWSEPEPDFEHAHLVTTFNSGSADFSAPQRSDVMPWMAAAVAADILGDDRDELVFTNGEGHIQICELASGEEPRVLFSTWAGNLMWNIDVADLNGDARLDVLVSESESGVVSVLMSEGIDGFGVPTGFGVCAGAAGIVAAELDGVPGTDIAVAGTQANVIAILSNNGQGNFPAPRAWVQQFNIGSIDVGDLDGDGVMDAAACGPSRRFPFYDNPGGLSLLFNRNGLLVQGLTYVEPRVARSVSVADFDEDQQTDVSVVSYGWPPGSSAAGVLQTHLNVGGGALSSPLSVEAVKGAWDSVTEDVNGDGAMDLVISTEFGAVTVFLNDGHGNFAPQEPLMLDGNFIEIVSADFGDGSPGFAVADMGLGVTRSPGGILILRNNAGTLSLSASAEMGQPWRGLLTADFNGDGLIDLAAHHYDSGGEIALLLGKGGGQFARGPEVPRDISPFDLGSGDYDGDGDEDLLVSDYVQIGLLLNDGEGTFAQPILLGGSVILREFEEMDVGGDGDLDVLAAGQASVWLLRNESNPGTGLTVR